MPRRDPLNLAVRIGVYIFLYFVTAFVFVPTIGWLAGPMAGFAAGGLLAAIFSNALAMRIFEARALTDIGLRWGRLSRDNLAIGFAGGAGAAALAVAASVAMGARYHAAGGAAPGPSLLLSVILVLGAFHEEMLLRGYGFQILLRATSPFATILPVAVVFALLHTSNPSFTWMALANTAGFGILFGYAFLRSRDLWLPAGLHLGWNLTLALAGANVSGFRMRMTGYELEWKAAPLLTGGAYGPEASLLASAVLVAAFFWLRSAPVRRQASPLLDPPGDLECAPPGLSSPPPSSLPVNPSKPETS